jgi:hypothetical protein
MFSWYEAESSGGTLTARCRVFGAGGTQYQAEWLTRSAGGVGSFARQSIGDYTKSAGFHLGQLPAFAAIWPESGKVRGNIVQMITR